MKFINLDDVPIRKLRSLAKRINWKKLFSVASMKGIALLLALAVFPIQLAVAEPSANANGTDALSERVALVSSTALVQPQYEQMTVTATAYNSLKGQTDDSPCIAARGYNLCEANMENVIAANFLPMGTKIIVPELHGDQVFTVVDRMNSRYSKYCSDTECRLDFWMREYSDARKFGKQTVDIIVLSRPE
ncbi:MAG: hypothetical protein COU11_04800 [Candidatus Harrisonbacteria bacterium CG10_big_fil_rev_8_21_14_0_10_49_15]|uniref:3D domain-containing protein n=1 Tax=Candidatus Harrisonbacteria bacterium CG10_big_fil_rev_8_21_14_0_10_49_15 TaxID=1974587 RepID=A0A2H0UJP8_9BACT|nr:MAG: hypothetical protein COU11_04800 [Candidatus Harrisonbacteria bacterium CG10_big_fil_rev_8_21_14_0_10_49_15]